MFAVNRRNWKNALDVVTSLVMVFAAVMLVIVALNRDGAATSTIKAPVEPISIAGAMTKGSAKAEKVLVVFSDFECPFCGRFAREILPELERRYVSTGKLALVFRHFPLPIHSRAVKAAVSADCAGEQRRFWEMHDLLFAEGAALDDVGISTAASKAGLEMTRFQRCMQTPEMTDNVTSSVR